MPKFLKIILVVLLCLLVLTGIFLIIAMNALNNAKNVENYVIDNNSVPSIKTVVGERNITNVSTSNSNGTIVNQYKYENIESTYNDLIKYVDELKSNHGFVITKAFNLNEKDGTLQLSKNASEDGKIFIVEITWTQNSYTVYVALKNGTIAE